MISRKSIDQVLGIARIEDVVEDFVNLKRRGSNMIGLCPFHDEKTPSFIVSPAKNFCKCFGCGKGGTPVGFIMEHESLSYPEAIRYLAKRYNIQLEETEQTAEQKQEAQIQDSLYILTDFATNYFQDQLFNTPIGKAVGLSYFKERGFLEKTIKDFQLGYAPPARDQLTQTALQANFNKEYLEQVGLTTKTGNDFFKDRVMFTIHNLSGKVIAFAGRTLSTDKRVPKYINSPETEIYNKRKVLYGLYQSKATIRKEDVCFMVEGYTDVITLHQGGITNVVASSGTSLTEDQVRLVKRYTENITILYDGDAAGIKAAIRGLDIVLQQDMNVKVVLLPNGEDPDSYLKSVGSTAFKTYIQQNAKDFILFKTELLLGEVGNDPIAKTGVTRDIVSSVARIPDIMKRSLYTKQVSHLMGIDETILVSEINKVVKQDQKRRQIDIQRSQLRAENEAIEEERRLIEADPEAITQKNVAIQKDYWQERDIIRVLLHYGEKIYDKASETTVLEYILSNIEDLKNGFEDQMFHKIIDIYRDMLSQDQIPTSTYFIHHEDMTIQQCAQDILMSPYTYADWESHGVLLQTQKPPEENYVRDAFQAVMRYKLKKVKREIDELQASIQNPESFADGSIDAETLLKVLQFKMNERNAIASQLSTIIL